MSQLNLKQILSGDNLSTVVDKLNYNFDQIILNGGGPQGLRGILGSPGLPGPRGLIGVTGPEGEHGTYIFAGYPGPTGYPFVNPGLTGYPFPRDGDIFIETQPNALGIYELGASGWNLIQLITSPSSALIQLQEQGSNVPSISNDPSIAGKFFIGSTSSFIPGNSIDPSVILDQDFGTHTFVASLSDPWNYHDSILTLAGEKNQFRIFSNNLSGCEIGPNNTGSPAIIYDRGGIVHSLEESSSKQVYRIVNADLNGDKHFSLRLNQSSTLTNTLLYGDLNNRLGVGINEFETLTAQLTVNNSIVVGDSSFYPYANFLNSQGIISQGNLAVGTTDNQYHTGAFYGALSSVASIIADIDSSLADRESNLTLSSDYYSTNGAEYNSWKFAHFANKSFGNSRYRHLSLSASMYEIEGPTIRTDRNVIEFGLTAGNNFGSSTVLPNIGVGGIIDPYSLFEIGGAPYSANNISIGQMGGGTQSFDASNYIGFNLHRSPVTNSWLKRTDATNNSGKAIWGGMYDQSLNISFFPSGYSGASATNLIGITDAEVTENTRVSIHETGAIHNDNQYRAAYFLDPNLGLYIGFGPTGTVGTSDPGSGGNILSTFRSPVAYFGKWTQDGAPVIYATNGVNQSVAVYGSNIDVLPQYAFNGTNGGGTMGMYLAQGGIGNTATFGQDAYQTGLASNGVSALSASGNWWSGGIVGINQRNPRERFQISEKLVFHDESFQFGGGINSNGTSYFGYNIYSKWNAGSGTLETFRMSGSSTGIKEGYTKIAFPEFGMTDSSGLSRFNTVGTKIVLEVGNLGATNDSPSTTLPYDNTNTVSTYRGVIISSPPQGPSTSSTPHQNMSNYVPQVGVGLKLDNTYSEGGDSNVSGRRGTLAVAAQMRMKPNPIGPFGYTQEDIYNIGLYNFEGHPVAAIGAAGGNPSNTTSKTLEIDFIGTNGDVLYEDVTLLHASVDNNLTNKYQRTAQFGDSFRIGVNEAPNVMTTLGNISSLVTGYSHDIAPLSVSAGLSSNFYTGTPVYNPAAIMRGSLIIDQTPFTNSNDGLWFKDASITGSTGSVMPGGAQGTRTTPINKDAYAGDWKISYKRYPAGSGLYTSPIAGLAFTKPTDTVDRTPFYIDDTGSVAIGFGINLTSANLVYTPGGGTDFHGIGSTAYWTAGTAQRVALSVNGTIKSGGIMTSSDIRLKTDINDIETSLDKIKLLKPVSYEFKDAPGIPNKGFIAQDILEIYPEIVRKFDDSDFEDGKLSLDYNSFIPILTKGIQEQQEIIEKQAETIKNLEDRLSKIEELLSKK